jgi:hypothetical protein
VIGAESTSAGLSAVLARIPINLSDPGLGARFEDNGGNFSMGFFGGPVSRQVDYWVGLRRPGLPAVERRVDPPLVSLSSTATAGRFYPGSGWPQKRVIELREQNGSILADYPVNLSVNTGTMDVTDDCSNMVFVEDEEIRNFSINDQCDSRSFAEPSDFAARIPFDEGQGIQFSDTTETYQGSIRIEDGTPADERPNRWNWRSGRFDLGMQFDERAGENDDVFANISLSGVQLGASSFSVVFWFRMNGSVEQQPNFREVGTDRSENHRLYLFYYADITPALRIWNYSDGSYRLQGLYNPDGAEPVNVTVEDPTMRELDGNVWHQVGLTFNRTSRNMSVFVDGRRVAFNDSITDLMGTTPQVYTIGKGLDGSVDEFKVYTRPLSADEIRDMYVQHTDLSVRTDLGLLRSESDLSLYAGANFGVNRSFTNLSVTGGERSIGSPPTSRVSDIKRYSSLIQRLRANAVSGPLQRRLSMEVLSRCTDLGFQTARISLSEVVC